MSQKAWEYSAAAHVGDRSSQQDNLRVLPWPEPDPDPGGTGLLMILADGMGGYTGGATAAALAAEMAKQSFLESNKAIRQRLLGACLAANLAIGNAKQQDSRLEHMGTTLIIACAAGNEFHWVSVGDSALWLWRNRELIRINQDHSMAPLLKADSENHHDRSILSLYKAQRSALRSALTGHEIHLIDLPDQPLYYQPGDWLIAATDGLLALDSTDISHALSSADSTEAAVRLMFQEFDALQGKNRDNASLIVMRRI